MSQRVTIYDGSSWANPADENNKDAMWRLRYSTEYNRGDILRVLELADGYVHLMLHPAMTLSEAAKRISGVRKAVR